LRREGKRGGRIGGDPGSKKRKRLGASENQNSGEKKGGGIGPQAGKRGFKNSL